MPATADTLHWRAILRVTGAYFCPMSERKKKAYRPIRAREEEIPKGPIHSSNIAIAEMRHDLATIIRNNIGKLDADLASLEPKDRIMCVTRLAEYVLPKQKEVAAHVDGEISQNIQASLSNLDDLFGTNKD